MRIPRNTIVGLNEIKLFLALGLVLGIFLMISLAADSRRGISLDPQSIVTAESPFRTIELTAKAAYVYDVRTKEVLYAHNEKARLPLASLTKVMSALVAEDILPRDSIVTISREALRSEGDTGLLAGERWKLGDLIDFSLTVSSNDGMRAVGLVAGKALTGSSDPTTAEAAFVHEMNTKADELQMKNTYYFNETGLDESSVKGGAYGSAEDMARLLEFVLSTNPSLIEATQKGRTTISSLDKVHTAKNTDILTNLIPGLLASKTGYTDLAGGNLIIAFDPELGHPIIISVLGSTEKGRFEDMTKLINASLESLSSRDQTVSK